MLIALTLAALLHAAPVLSRSPHPASLTGTASDTVTYLRINQVGYLPDAPKVAVACSLDSVRIASFVVKDERGRTVLGPRRAVRANGFGPCVVTHRLDFSALRKPGRYRIVAGGAQSPIVRIGRDVYAGAADTLLYYMREQRSGWNPVFRDSVHTHDGIIVDSPRAGQFIPVSGGWADASDYLQYVTTSANATYVMLMAYRDHPRAFADDFAANGLPGANGRPTCSTKRATGSSGCCACSRATARCTTSSPTIGITPSSTCR
jgi:hypothetical protein